MGQEILELSIPVLFYFAPVGPGRQSLMKAGFSAICVLWSDHSVSLRRGAMTDVCVIGASQHFSPGQVLWFDKDLSAAAESFLSV